MDLWHYTTLEGLKGVLSTQRLWATEYRHLNDSSELYYSKAIISSEVLPWIQAAIEQEIGNNLDAKRIVEAFGGLTKFAATETEETISIMYQAALQSTKYQPIPCVLAFCEESSNDNGLLSQWRGYGRDGGYALVFDKDVLIKEFKTEEDGFCYAISNHGKVVYDIKEIPNDHEIKTCLDTIRQHVYELYRLRVYREQPQSKMTKELEAFVRCMMLLKHVGFKEEREYRFYAFAIEKDARQDPTFPDIFTKQFKEICSRNKNGMTIPYIEMFEKSKNLPLKKICVGPHRDKELRAKSLKIFLNSIDMENIDVYCSNIPFVGF